MFSLVSLLLVSIPSHAKLNIKNAYDLSGLCHKRNRNLKNYAEICACQKKNFSWLLSDNQWKIAKAIYTEKVSREEMKKRDEWSSIDYLIVTVENRCSANQSYFAPKAKMLLKKSKR